MYIEQSYKSQGGVWKYLPLPIVFISFIAYNFYLIKSTEMNVEEVMKDTIALIGRNAYLFITLFQFAIGLAFVFFVVKYFHKQSIRSLTTSRSKIDWKRVGFSALMWAVIGLVTTLTEVFLHPESYQLQFDLGNFAVLFLIAILMIPLQTSFEEYLFRGYMMQGIGRIAKYKWVPFIVTSVLFGLMHIGNPEIEKMGYGVLLYYISTGFFLGIVTLMDEGLELALGFHAANNTISALLVTSSWTAFQTDSIYLDLSKPELNWEVFFPVLVIYPILLYVFAKKYGWTNWKDKLVAKITPKNKIISTYGD